jgi:hypothetical protein
LAEEQRKIKLATAIGVGSPGARTPWGAVRRIALETRGKGAHVLEIALEEAPCVRSP